MGSRRTSFLQTPGDPMYEAALALWRHREQQFPPHVRREKPDAYDIAGGAWARICKDAEAAVEGYLNALHGNRNKWRR